VLLVECIRIQDFQYERQNWYKVSSLFAELNQNLNAMESQWKKLCGWNELNDSSDYAHQWINERFIETEREKINFTLKETQLITAWETTMKNKGTPLLVYYNNWVKTNFTKKKRQAIQSENINDYDIPSIKRKLPGTEKAAQEGPVELFPSDDENEDSEAEQQPKPKKAKKEKKVEDIAEDVAEVEEDDDFEDDGVDIVKDLDLDDW